MKDTDLKSLLKQEAKRNTEAAALPFRTIKADDRERVKTETNKINMISTLETKPCINKRKSSNQRGKY